MEHQKGKILKFPPGFLWGVSTAAYQIEGGIRCDWSEWEQSEGRKKALEEKSRLEGKDLELSDYICGQACGSYERWAEDIEIIKNMNCNAYRFGVEWARIEPEEGKIDKEAIAHYRNLLVRLKENKIKTVLTLWHWTNPVWIGSAGWQKEDTVEKFIRFTELIVKELGGLVDYWITLNEPMMHIYHGYLDGKFPPQLRIAFLKIPKVFNNLVSANNLAFKIIHKHYPDAKVSIAMTTGFAEPAHKYNPIEKMMVQAYRYLRNDMFLNKIKGHYDFIGVNYYHHDRVIWHPPFRKNLYEKVSDFGWEIYPEGIYHVLKDYQRFDKPILIIESGISDAKDIYRKDYIRDILRWTHKAIEEGVRVEGHFYWSLFDNFEWADGYGQKFGLIAVNHRTFERTKRPSADYYASICKNNAVEI